MVYLERFDPARNVAGAPEGGSSIHETALFPARQSQKWPNRR
jgi:hypothetical protein